MPHKKTEAEPGMTKPGPPGFIRRLAAALYDFLLLLAVLFLATAVALPFNSGEAFSSDQTFYLVYLLIISFIFYGWFWTHGGQTLGLRSWKMVLQTTSQEPVSWKQAFVRFFTAAISWLFLGLGFFWALINKKKLTWHDILSGTMLVLKKDC